MGENPTGAVNPVTAIPEIPEDTLSCPADTAVAVGTWLGETRSEIGHLFRFAYRSSRDASDRMVHRIQSRARYLREERPLPLLWAISGCAFALGIGLAIWRSRRS